MNLHSVLYKGQGRRLLAGGAVAALGLALGGAAAMTAQAAPAPGMDVTLCHRTGSADGGNQKNGYDKITVNINSVEAATDAKGHATENNQVGNGPGGDIIPAYTYVYTKDGVTASYDFPGLNLGGTGQAFLNNGCKAATLLRSVTADATSDSGFLHRRWSR